MIQPFLRKKELSFSTLCLEVHPLGEDIAALLYGGERPHIGCTVLAVPRPSLTGDGHTSCTSSVLNVTGHKDEQICRRVAEVLCRHYGATVVCAGGFHQDAITEPQLREVMDALEELLS